MAVNRTVLWGGVGAAVLAVAGGAGWFFYNQYQANKDTQACFMGTDPDACFRQATRAFKAGKLTEVDDVLERHCLQRAGMDPGNASRGAGNLLALRVCLSEIRGRVEAAAALR